MQFGPKTILTRLCLGALFAALVSFPQAARAQSAYSITDLDSLGGGESMAFGINNRNQVVGTSLVTAGSGIWHPFFWEVGVMKDIGTLGGTSGNAFAINDLGYAVGSADTAQSHLRPFIWSDLFSKRDLGTLGGSFSTSWDVNNSSQVVGQSEAAFLEDRAFLFTSSAGIQQIAALGDTQSVARGINESGHIVGDMLNGMGQTHAFLLVSGVLTDLGTLGGTFSRAYEVGDDGTVVGYSTTVVGGISPPSHAFSYTTGGGMVDLGTLGGNHSQAFDINNEGQIVGFAEVAGGVAHAFLYASGTMFDLNDAIPPGTGWLLTHARGINNQGRIVGYGQLNGVTRAFMLVPNFVAPPETIDPCRRQNSPASPFGIGEGAGTLPIPVSPVPARRRARP